MQQPFTSKSRPQARLSTMDEAHGLLESSLHQISPYIGKLKPTIAASLIESYTKPADVVYDPFCGCGTIPLEARLRGRGCIGTDISPYAIAVTKAKLWVPPTLEAAKRQLQRANQIASSMPRPRLTAVPQWVRSFYHPATLREILCWFAALRDIQSPFLTGCLLCLLHHQRPGFLSYPASNAVPYLRCSKYPKSDFPDMYAYRDVYSRLERKIARTFRRIPDYDTASLRLCKLSDARLFSTSRAVNAIITSPPYMAQLDYARDNRLRLWFLGNVNHIELEKSTTPGATSFPDLMRRSLSQWSRFLRPGGLCVLVLGDHTIGPSKIQLHDLIAGLAVNELKLYEKVELLESLVPNIRRVRRELRGTTKDFILVLRHNKK